VSPKSLAAEATDVCWMLAVVLAGCGARSFEPGGRDGRDGGLDAGEAPHVREPTKGCSGHEEGPDLTLRHGHFEKGTSTMTVRFSVGYCGVGNLEQTVLARVLRRDPDGAETILFEDRTQPGLPPEYQEYLGPVVIPYDEGDCILVEVDPEEEIEHCLQPRCNLSDLSCDSLYY